MQNKLIELKTDEQLLFEKTVKIYHSITRGSMDGFLIVDMQGHFLDVNDAYCELIGYDRKELLKMNMSDVEVGANVKDVEKKLLEIKKNGEARLFVQHRKKNSTSVDIEMSANYGDYLGGVIFVFAHNISKREKSKDALAKNHARSKDIIQGRLAESYKHLGTINRKISLLLELGKFPTSVKDKQKIIDHILSLAMSISKAPTGYLYGASGKGEFNLLSSRGLREKQKEKIRVISAQTVGLLKQLLLEKKLANGDIRQYEADLLALDNKLEYFVSLPLERGSGLGGFIFLGFKKKTTVNMEDLEFLDVFAMHASHALNRAGVLE